MSRLSVIQMEKTGYGCVGSCLRIPSDKVLAEDFGSEWLKQFILDMLETLYSNSSGVGLAANQVGVMKRVCIIDLKRDGKKPIVLVNPKYEPIVDDIIDSQEVCLSFPLVRSNVKRYKKVRVTYQTIYGEEKIVIAEGFKATVFQHEIDHLNGIIHIDLDKNTDNLQDYCGYSVKLAQNALNKLLLRGENMNE